ncbi:MAG: substrate-binding domain-containing protein [Motiliproteus sp.]
MIATLLCLLPNNVSSAASESTPIVITHPSVGVEKLSRSTLRSIFTVRLTRWQDGMPIRVFVLPDNHPSHQQFSKKNLGVFPYRLRQIWDRMVFSGIGKAPMEVVDQAAMQKEVARTPGAIGYIADGSGSSGVNYVVVE